MSQPITFPPGQPIELAKLDPAYHDPDETKESAKEKLRENAKRLDELGHRLYAENHQALLLVLQGMDTSGKDGTVRHVLRGVNPQSCRIRSFKKPSDEESDHDFLWRIHKAVPRRGEVGIFNRSHYEDVLIVRVLNLVPESEWRTRYERINEFERLLTEGRIKLVKCFLYISKEEQLERLQSRLDRPDKRWKFNPDDLDARAMWDDYMAAYEEALNRCNTDHAPWHVIPSDRKWARNLAVSELLVRTLESMDPQFPDPMEGLDQIQLT